MRAEAQKRFKRCMQRKQKLLQLWLVSEVLTTAMLRVKTSLLEGSLDRPLLVLLTEKPVTADCCRGKHKQARRSAWAQQKAVVSEQR